MDIDQMQAGPELDALIAIEVMGWTRTRKKRTSGPMAGVVVVSPWFPVGESATRKNSRMDFRPSIDIAHAWEAVEELRDLEREVTIQLSSDGLSVTCHIDLTNHPTYLSSEADEAPLAICRAALKAVRS